MNQKELEDYHKFKKSYLKWEEYEKFKKSLSNLTSDEYEEAIKKYCKKNKI